jgi:hypothetical protein
MPSGMGAVHAHAYSHRHYAKGYRGPRGLAANRPRILSATPYGVYYRYSPGIKPQGPGFAIGFSVY